MLHRIMPARLQDVVEPDDVALNIHIGILNAIAHASLDSQVHHNIELVFLEQFINQFAVGNASLHELVIDIGWFGLIQLAKTVLFE